MTLLLLLPNLLDLVVTTFGVDFVNLMYLELEKIFWDLMKALRSLLLSKLLTLDTVRYKDGYRGGERPNVGTINQMEPH